MIIFLWRSLSHDDKLMRNLTYRHEVRFALQFSCEGINSEQYPVAAVAVADTGKQSSTTVCERSMRLQRMMVGADDSTAAVASLSKGVPPELRSFLR